MLTSTSKLPITPTSGVRSSWLSVDSMALRYFAAASAASRCAVVFGIMRWCSVPPTSGSITTMVPSTTTGVRPMSTGTSVPSPRTARTMRVG